jgi:phosphoribosylformylglycinamidine synthase subunit PurQ / glutaminase
MKWGIVVFPGSNCDQDMFHAVKNVLHCDVTYIWHKTKDLKDIDVLVLPGGFSYGDYLRCGALAKFSPIMEEVIKFAKSGKPVIGVCNGFQILIEAGLLPGALVRNKTLKFICKSVATKVETSSGTWTKSLKKDQILEMPIAHGDGQYFTTPEGLKELEENDQIALRYVEENPNGSVSDIAGIYNKEKNILGLMPHPERAAETLLGSADGKLLLESVL